LLRAMTGFSRVPEMDVIVICVPTPLTKNLTLDLQYVESVTRSIASHLRKRQLVTLESTTYPGTTEEVMLPILESTGLKVEEDFYLANSPENVINPCSFIERKSEFKETLVKRGATIGANATVVCGNTIGSYALVGASALVTRDVPDYALFYGNPGKIQGWVCRCGEKLTFIKDKARCPACRLSYIQISAEEIRED